MFLSLLRLKFRRMNGAEEALLGGPPQLPFIRPLAATAVVRATAAVTAGRAGLLEVAKRGRTLCTSLTHDDSP
jgi:hypothetical protein